MNHPKDAKHDAVPEIEELLLLVRVVLPAPTSKRPSKLWGWLSE